MTSALLRLSVLTFVFGGAVAPALAEDNLIGLPIPKVAERPGAVVLHGGGSLTKAVFERFIELAGGKDARIILVPSAGYLHSDYDSEEHFLIAMRSRFGSWVRLQSSGRIASFQFLYTDDPDDADADAFVQPLDSATGVWLSGGLQPRLNYRFVGNFPEQTRFQMALREIVARGGVVGGTSAGMAALPEVMTMFQDREYEQAPATAVAAHGLGLFDGAIVEQHFDRKGGRLERFTGLLRDSPQLDSLTGRKDAGLQMLGLAVEERTGLILQGDRLHVLGYGNAHVFAKADNGRTVIWHQLAAGEAARLKRDTRGAAQLHRESVPAEAE